MVEQQHDIHVQSWAVEQLRDITHNTTWNVTKGGDFIVGGPQGRLERYKEIIVRNSSLVESDQIQVRDICGEGGTEGVTVPKSLRAAQLMIPKEIGQNSFFHREMRAVSGQFLDACENAARENIADMLKQAFA